MLKVMANLQSKANQVSAEMIGTAMQLDAARAYDADDIGIDIVAGYLEQATDDTCAMAEAMRDPFRSLHEISRLAELADRSFKKFEQAFRLWKERLLH